MIIFDDDDDDDDDDDSRGRLMRMINSNKWEIWRGAWC